MPAKRPAALRGPCGRLQGSPGLLQADFVQRALVLVGEDVEVAVRALAHITNTRLEPAQQAFLVLDPITVELQPDQLLAGQGANEYVVLPGLEGSLS